MLPAYWQPENPEWSASALQITISGPGPPALPRPQVGAPGFEALSCLQPPTCAYRPAAPGPTCLAAAWPMAHIRLAWWRPACLARNPVANGIIPRRCVGSGRDTGRPRAPVHAGHPVGAPTRARACMCICLKDNGEGPFEHVRRCHQARRRGGRHGVKTTTNPAQRPHATDSISASQIQRRSMRRHVHVRVGLAWRAGLGLRWFGRACMRALETQPSLTRVRVGF